MANSVDPDQTAPIGADFSGSTLFATILNSSVMLDNYLQQTTSADDIFRCIFLSALRVSVMTPGGNTYRYFSQKKGYLMLHHLAGATIQVANLVNYNRHPQEDGNNRMPIERVKATRCFSLLFIISRKMRKTYFLTILKICRFFLQK